ncbi:hypothetical protein ACFO4U_06825 [Exiguobacterium profundum]|uniref:hypothetical protein n=1 Tax=Exiguobacterium TaxID=33986 RepID=UPI001BFCBBD3|nr:MULTISPECIES: hypothetical protein [Exiguobacterium]MCT4799416.1 hypothetical protein [Exiguobacterium profundum]
MRFETVVYKNSAGVKEVIELKDIAERPDYEVVKKNLYCGFDNCPSRIEYVPKGKKIAHFRTWPKDNHSEDCVNYFEREIKNASIKNSAINTAKLKDSHIRDILKTMHKNANETLEEKQLRLSKQRDKYKKKKNSTVDSSKVPIVENVVRPSTNNDEQYQIEGKRAPNVRRRYSPNDISESDIGNAIGIIGNMLDIQLFDKRCIFTLKGRNNRFNLYFEEEFYSSAALNIDTTLKSLKQILDRGTTISLACVGNVVKRRDEICMIVSNPNHIRVDNYTMEAYIYKSNNL